MIAISAAVIAGAMVLMIYAAKVAESVNARGGCSSCNTPVPTFRRPTSFRQALWGGWTCESCGTEMDRNGYARARVES